jgi:hypothetical protein
MARLKAATALARVFAAVAEAEYQTESTAAGILAIIKDKDVTTVEKWNEAVKDAYEKNGWNVRVGRPTNGAKAMQAVPQTVASYVSLVRAALRAKMRVAKYDSFTALRVAMAKRNGRADHRGGVRGAAIPKDLRENFRGTPIANHAETNGALFHDLGAVFIHLPADHRAMFGRQLNQLMAKYAPLAKGLKHPTPALPAPKEEAKEAKAA